MVQEEILRRSLNYWRFSNFSGSSDIEIQIKNRCEESATTFGSIYHGGCGQ